MRFNNGMSLLIKCKAAPFIDENKFRDLYSEKEEHPNASIKVMVSILIFIGLKKRLGAWLIVCVNKVACIVLECIDCVNAAP